MNKNPNKQNFAPKFGVVVLVLVFLGAIFGTLVVSAWYLPSPWYLLGAFPATLATWLMLRENRIETIVIFFMLLGMLWLIRPPIQAARDYFKPVDTLSPKISED